MPASSAEVIGAALQSAYRHPPSAPPSTPLQHPSKASATALSDQLSVCGKQVLNSHVEYEPAGRQQMLVLDSLKAKYVTLNSTHPPAAPQQPASTPSMAQAPPRPCQGAKEDQLEEPQVVLWPRDKVTLGWRKSFPPGAGMVNLGNTCYLNSSLQALFHIPALANWLLEELQSHTQRCEANTANASFCSVCAMMRTLRATLDRSTAVIKPALIQHKLKSIGKTLMYGRQEDAHEFIKLLLDHMEKSYLTFRRATKLDHRSKETTPLNQIFGGYLRQQVICPLCRYVSTTFSHFQDLVLDIRSVNSVDEALNLHFRKETLDSENAYRCERCHKKVPATKRHLIERAPHVLLIQLKRFTMSGGKIGKHVNIQRTIDISRFVSSSGGGTGGVGKQGGGGAGGGGGGGGGGGPFQYRLASMVIHLGGSQHGGHYTAVAEASTGTMFEFDDSSVRSISLQSALLRNPYILFYEMVRRPREQQQAALKQVVRQSSEKVLIRQNSDGITAAKLIPTSHSASPVTNGFPHHTMGDGGGGGKVHLPPPLPCHKERERLSFALKSTQSKAVLPDALTAKPSKIILNSSSTSLLGTKNPPPISSSTFTATKSFTSSSSSTSTSTKSSLSSSSASSASSSTQPSLSSTTSSSISSSKAGVMQNTSVNSSASSSSSSSSSNPSSSKLVSASSSSTTSSTNSSSSKLVSASSSSSTSSTSNYSKSTIPVVKSSTSSTTSTSTSKPSTSTTLSAKSVVPSLVPYPDDSEDSEVDECHRGAKEKNSAKMNGVKNGKERVIGTAQPMTNGEAKEGEAGTKSRAMLPRALQVVPGGASRNKGETGWQVTDAALHSPSESSSGSNSATRPFTVVDQPASAPRPDPDPDTQGWTVTVVEQQQQQQQQQQQRRQRPELEKSLSHDCVMPSQRGDSSASAREGDSASLRSKASVDSGRSDRSTKSMKRSIMALFTCVSAARSPDSPPAPPSPHCKEGADTWLPASTTTSTPVSTTSMPQHSREGATDSTTTSTTTTTTTEKTKRSRELEDTEPSSPSKKACQGNQSPARTTSKDQLPALKEDQSQARGASKNQSLPRKSRNPSGDYQSPTRVPSTTTTITITTSTTAITASTTTTTVTTTATTSTTVTTTATATTTTATVPKNGLALSAAVAPPPTTTTTTTTSERRTKNCQPQQPESPKNGARTKGGTDGHNHHNGTGTAGKSSSSTSTSSLSSSSDDSEDEEEEGEGRWVEKTKETIGSARLHPAPNIIPWNGTGQGREKGKKSGLWDGTRSSAVVDELRRAGNTAYGTDVNAWGGGQSVLDKEAEQMRREAKKRSAEDQYNEEMDSGRTKKLKSPKKTGWDGGGSVGGSSQAPPNPPPWITTTTTTTPNTTPHNNNPFQRLQDWRTNTTWNNNNNYSNNNNNNRNHPFTPHHRSSPHHHPHHRYSSNSSNGSNYPYPLPRHPPYWENKNGHNGRPWRRGGKQKFHSRKYKDKYKHGW